MGADRDDSQGEQREIAQAGFLARKRIGACAHPDDVGRHPTLLIVDTARNGLSAITRLLLFLLVALDMREERCASRQLERKRHYHQRLFRAGTAG